MSSTNVFLYGTHLGELSRPKRDRLRFDFSDEAHQRWGSGSPILSNSMRLSVTTRPTNDRTRNFFENLLPEGDDLYRLRSVYDARDNFDVLKALGRDSAGALYIMDDFRAAIAEQEAEQADTHERGGFWLADDDVYELLANLGQRPLGVTDNEDVRHSLAGAQSKLLLGRSDAGRWHVPTLDRPSTWILKPSRDEREVRNEHFCMELARRSGLPACQTERFTLGDLHVLAARRYDREGAQKLHQEDGCQALGIPASEKYQRRTGSGRKPIGPSLKGIAGVLPATLDRRYLLRAQVLNVLIGNADCHGKNVSMLHLSDGSVRLAPSYDLMSTACLPPREMPSGPRPYATDLGMFIGNATRLEDVTWPELAREARSWPLDPPTITSEFLHAERVADEAAAMQDEYPEIARYVRDRYMALRDRASLS